jgi:hypothetical protein
MNNLEYCSYVASIKTHNTTLTQFSFLAAPEEVAPKKRLYTPAGFLAKAELERKAEPEVRRVSALLLLTHFLYSYDASIVYHRVRSSRVTIAALIKAFFLVFFLPCLGTDSICACCPMSCSLHQFKKPWRCSNRPQRR